MKNLLFSLVFLVIANLAYADLAGDLRSLRGTVSEMANTSKELSTISGQANSNQQANTSQNTGASSRELKSGDVLTSKINKIKLFKEPSKKSDKAGMLSKGEDMIYMGEEANGFYKVTATNGEGWVEKLLVQKTN